MAAIPTRKVNLIAFSIVLAALLTSAVLTAFSWAPAAASPNALCTVTSASDSGAGTLREQLADPSCSKIDFAGSYTINLDSPLQIGRSVWVDASGQTVTLSGDSGNDGSPNVRIFTIDASGAVTLTHLVVRKGEASGMVYPGLGGGIYIAGGSQVTVQDSRFELNQSLHSGGNSSGGAIYNLGSLVIQNSSFYTNQVNVSNGFQASGGAIYNANKLQVHDSIFHANKVTSEGGGGAISSALTMTVTGSTFYENDAAKPGGAYVYGGAIYNLGAMHLASSLLYSNTADYRGAAIYTDLGTARIENTTISGNWTRRTDGIAGGIYNQDILYLVQTTVVDNMAPLSGAGVVNSGGALYLMNSILANNRGSADCTSVIGTVYSNHALVENSTCGGTFHFDPQLGPLVNNGGTMLSHMPLPDSPVLDAGSDAVGVCLHTDQLGASRPLNSHCDLGAVEAPAQAILHLSKTASPVTQVQPGTPVTYTVVLANSGALDAQNVVLTDTLPAKTQFKQWLIQPSGASENANVVRWSGSVTSSQSVTFTFQVSQTGSVSEIITNTVVYSRPAAAGSASAAFRLACEDAFQVTNGNDSGPGSLRLGVNNVCDGGRITFAGDTLVRLASPLNGQDRAILIDGSAGRVTISGDSDGNGSPDVGAFVIDSSGFITLTHLSVVSATLAVNNNGTLYAEYCTFADNALTGGPIMGGAILNMLGTLTVNDCTFTGNSVSGQGAAGGAIANYMGLATIVNSTFVGNSVDGVDVSIGGAILNYGLMYLSNSTLTQNTATGGSAPMAGGGGLYNVYDLHLFNTIIAGSTGGDCLNNGGTVTENMNNLVEDGSCSQNGVNLLSGDPLLAPLADNGGGTLTQALLPGSPAIDRGDAASCGVYGNFLDQRGLPRTDLGCDIGAFELRFADSPTVHRQISSVGLTTFGPTLVGMRSDPGFTDPGVITVTKSAAWNVQGPESIAANWKIEPAVSTNISVTLQLCFSDAENTALLNVNDVRLWRREAGGAWAQMGGIPTLATDSFGNHCLTVAGVDGFSSWALATSAPTALGLKSFAARVPGMAIPAAAFGLGAVLLSAARRRRR